MTVTVGQAAPTTQQKQDLRQAFDLAGLDSQNRLLGANGGVVLDLEAAQAVAAQDAVDRYVGLVASRCSLPTTHNTANKQCFSRVKHVAMDAVTTVQLVYATVSTGVTNAETQAGGDVTIKASVEVNGVLRQVTFNGSSTGVCTPSGILVSDPVQINLRKGSAFYTRTFCTSAWGIAYDTRIGNINNLGSAPSDGDYFTYGVTTPDLTESLALPATNQTQGGLVPAAIIGLTSKPSFALVGDSRCWGSNERYPAAANQYGGIGDVARAVSKRAALINLAIPGEFLAGVAAGTNWVVRPLLAQYASHVICEYGINDHNAGTPYTTSIENLYLFAQRLGNKPMIQCTNEPRTTSTDTWRTTANQTRHAQNPTRVAFNDVVRFGLQWPFIGHIELADYVETSRNSGLWKAADRVISDAAMTSGSAVLGSASANFSWDDVGKMVAVAGAGAAGATLVAMIIGFTNTTTVTLSVSAGTTVAAAAAWFPYTSDGTHGSKDANVLIENSQGFAVLEMLS